MKTGVIKLTLEQHNTLCLIHKANAGLLTVQEAAQQLGLSTRQVKRLKKGVKLEGPAAVIHKNSLRKPSHALSEQLKKEILDLRKKPPYSQTNFKHFQELLEEHHQLSLSYSALYRLLKQRSISCRWFTSILWFNSANLGRV